MKVSALALAAVIGLLASNSAAAAVKDHAWAEQYLQRLRGNTSQKNAKLGLSFGDMPGSIPCEYCVGYQAMQQSPEARDDKADDPLELRVGPPTSPTADFNARCMKQSGFFSGNDEDYTGRQGKDSRIFVYQLKNDEGEKRTVHCRTTPDGKLGNARALICASKQANTGGRPGPLTPDIEDAWRCDNGEGHGSTVCIELDDYYDQAKNLQAYFNDPKTTDKQKQQLTDQTSELFLYALERGVAFDMYNVQGLGLTPYLTTQVVEWSKAQLCRKEVPKFLRPMLFAELIAKTPQLGEQRASDTISGKWTHPKLPAIARTTLTHTSKPELTALINAHVVEEMGRVHENQSLDEFVRDILSAEGFSIMTFLGAFATTHHYHVLGLDVAECTFEFSQSADGAITAAVQDWNVQGAFQFVAPSDAEGEAMLKDAMDACGEKAKDWEASMRTGVMFDIIYDFDNEEGARRYTLVAERVGEQLPNKATLRFSVKHNQGPSDNSSLGTAQTIVM